MLIEYFHIRSLTFLTEIGLMGLNCYLFSKMQMNNNGCCTGKETLWQHTCPSVDYVPVSKTSHTLLEVISVKLIGSPR